MISALEAEGLRLERGGRRLFDDLSFRLAPGEAIALTGPNGAGKTSLLRCLAGLLRPAAGAVRWRLPAGVAAPAGLFHWQGWQDGLKGAHTVDGELGFWARWAGAGAGDVNTAAHAFGLAALMDVDIRRLSAGQRRRAALARLYAPQRPVWLLDEPFAPLDAAWRERFGVLMARHLEGGGVVVAAVHDPLPVPARELRLGAAA